MRGEILFEKMTDIADEYISEAALGDAYGNPRRERQETALARFLSSGWGVACICFIVAVATLVGMAHWGQPGGPGSSSSPRFDFYYEIRNADGSAWSGSVRPGVNVYVDTTIINRGLPFFYTGASTEYCAHAQLVLQGDETVILSGSIIHTADIGTFPVKTGEKGHGTYWFTIYENTHPGVYDLVLSYDGEQEVFAGVLTVTTDSDPTATDSFGFDYSIFNVRNGDGELLNPEASLTATVSPGYSLIIAGTVINRGAPFSYTGSSSDFGPDAWLVLQSDESISLRGTRFYNDDEVTILVQPGDKGSTDIHFRVPEGAAIGVYDLVLGYQSSRQVFRGVLTVEEAAPPSTPIVHPTPDPTTTALLCNAYADYCHVNPAYVSIASYYGELSSGGIAVMMNGLDHTDALWSEQVGVADIRYTDGNRILFFCQDTFYTLPEAYSAKLLTNHDLAVIENLHREYAPFLYADPDEPSD
ncbi:MAG: hypothetical protein E7610_08145 [Ruminococcaceae bacterium]|nr:hypothetical protein [Oscillospiraceae bacterium]